MLRVDVETPADAELSTTLGELVAEGARRMLAAALEAEVDAYICALSDERDEHGHRLVVRNGHAVARSLVTGADPIEVRARGWTTAGWTRQPGSGCGSGPRSSRPGRGSPRRWPRCCG